MGEKKSKKATFVVKPVFDYLVGSETAGAKRSFTDEDEAKKYAEEILANGWKRFKTKSAEMPDSVEVEVYDTNGHCLEVLTCEPNHVEVVKPSWV